MCNPQGDLPWQDLPQKPFDEIWILLLNERLLWHIIVCNSDDYLIDGALQK